MSLETYKLYKNTVELIFDPKKHIYYVDGVAIDGITNVTGVIDKSGPLMWWAVQKVTLPFLQEKIKPNIKLDELELNTIFKEAATLYNKHKEAAADIGTIIHGWASDYILGKKPKKPKNPQLLNGVNAFLNWIREHKVKFIESEKKVFSKQFKFAGTLDAEGTINGELAIIDFKTSNRIDYPEYRMQVAAYLQARKEEYNKDYKAYWIIRFGKDDGEFETKCIPIEEHPKDFQAFLGALALKRRLNELKREAHS